MLGGEAAASGIGAVAEANDPKKQIMSPGFQKEVEAAGGVNKYVKMVQDRIPNLSAPKVEMSGTIPGRPEGLAATTGTVPSTAPAAPQVDFGLAGGYGGLTKFFGQVADRVQYNRAQEAARKTGVEAAKNAVEVAKLRAAFLKAMQPDIKLGTVESGLTKQQVVYRDGKPVSTEMMDEKGNVITKPVRTMPTQAQLHAEAVKQIAAASNPKQERMKINARLQELGFAPLP